MSTTSKRQSAKNAALAIAFEISTRSPTKKQPSKSRSKPKPKKQTKNSLTKPSTSSGSLSSKSVSKRGLIAGKDVYAVKRLLDKRIKPDGRIEYLVEWKGWSSRYNQWEPKENIISLELIKEFENRRKQNNSTTTTLSSSTSSSSTASSSSSSSSSTIGYRKAQMRPTSSNKKKNIKQKNIHHSHHHHHHHNHHNNNKNNLNGPQNKNGLSVGKFANLYTATTVGPRQARRLKAAAAIKHH